MKQTSLNPPIVIAASELTVGYPTLPPVIQQFTGCIFRGQFVGVFGANGAGKTTLLRCLLGLIKPMCGQLMVLGKKPTRGDLRIGYMPQTVPVLPAAMSGKALLAATLGGHRWGLPWLSSAQREEIAQVIEIVGAQDLVQRPFMQLSGGERRRLLLAQALLGHPKILLLDEPLANLDPHFQHGLIEVLTRVQKEFNVTILLTAHDINPLIGAMTQMLYLASGKAAMGSVDEVVNNQVLSHLYGSPIEVIRHHGRVFVIHSRTGQIDNVACH